MEAVRGDDSEIPPCLVFYFQSPEENPTLYVLCAPSGRGMFLGRRVREPPRAARLERCGASEGAFTDASSELNFPSPRPRAPPYPIWEVLVFARRPPVQADVQPKAGYGNPFDTTVARGRGGLSRCPISESNRLVKIWRPRPECIVW